MNRPSSSPALATTSSIESMGNLRPNEISDIISRSQNMMSRLGIEEKPAYTVQGPMIRCDLIWTFTNERGSPQIAEATSTGMSKKAALAHARTTLLGQIGIEEVVTDPERSKVRRIRELLLSKDLSSAVQEAVSFIHTSSSEAWGLFLPQLWRAVLASYKIIHVENVVRALDSAGNDG